MKMKVVKIESVVKDGILLSEMVASLSESHRNTLDILYKNMREYESCDTSSYVIIDEDTHNEIVKFHNYINIPLITTDITNDILEGVYPNNDNQEFVERLNMFRLHNLTVDDVLDKIIKYGIESMDMIDIKILETTK